MPKKFVVCDLNAIENRVLGWMTGCQPILDVFLQGKCPYLDFAVDLYHLPYDYWELNRRYEAGDPEAKEMRQKSKPAVLGCGYQMSGGEEIETEDGDVIKTGLWGYGQGMGVELTRKEAHDGVAVFREKFGEVKQFWYDVEQAALRALRDNQPQEIGPVVIEFFGVQHGVEAKLMRIMLPSGRGLHYIRPRLEKYDLNGREKEGLTYEGKNQQTKQWGPVRTYGGKLTENIDQAIARDLLAVGLMRADQRGFEVVAHVHDEIVAVVDGVPNVKSGLGLEELRECMIEQVSWAPDLPLGGGGYEDVVYRKG